MARLSTCKGCSKKLHPEEKNTHNSKSYCSQCYEIVKRESEEYKQLIDFICVNYVITRPTGLILKQIKELRNEYDYSYAAMTYTLWYCKEVIEKQLIEKYGVALIKHYYDEARDYYSNQEKIKEKMKGLENVEIKSKVIKKCKDTNVENTNKSLINLNLLLEGGDNH